MNKLTIAFLATGVVILGNLITQGIEIAVATYIAKRAIKNAELESSQQEHKKEAVVEETTSEQS